MASLRDYYDTDFSATFSISREQTFQSPDTSIVVAPHVHFDVAANAKFLTCFIPVTPNAAEFCSFLVEFAPTLLAESPLTEFETGMSGQNRDDYLTMSSTVFTGRFFLYTESALSEEVRQRLRDAARSKGIHVAFRGPDYASARASFEHPAAFVSHDSRDKDAVGRPIALGLAQRACPVWFDEYSLKVGDRLRESIEKGLKECSKCILVISPRFLSNPGWTRHEFDSVFTRELMEGKDIILPVWHEVSKREVYDYCPALADRVALDWKSGKDVVVPKLHSQLVR